MAVFLFIICDLGLIAGRSLILPQVESDSLYAARVRFSHSRGSRYVSPRAYKRLHRRRKVCHFQPACSEASCVLSLAR